MTVTVLAQTIEGNKQLWKMLIYKNICRNLSEISLERIIISIILNYSIIVLTRRIIQGLKILIIIKDYYEFTLPQDSLPACATSSITLKSIEIILVIISSDQ